MPERFLLYSYLRNCAYHSIFINLLHVGYMRVAWVSYQEITRF